MILADGSPLGSEPIIMEIGSFGSFLPTMENMDQWLIHWKVFDAITSSDADVQDNFIINGIDPTMAKFTGSANLVDGQVSDSEDASPTVATFGAGEQGYIFFRTGDPVVSSSQCLLLTNTVWTFPALIEGLPQSPKAWWLDGADTAIVGAINGGDANGGDTGGGSSSDTSTDFAVRLHMVPEPGASLLLLLAALFFVGRRRSPAPKTCANSPAS